MLRASAFVFDFCLGDALDGYGFEYHGRLGLVLAAARYLGNFVRDVLAFDNFTEDRVVAGEPRCGRNGDKKLASIGSGATVGHGQLAGLVELVGRALSLVLKAVAGTTHSRACGVAALDHEVGNDAVKNGS